MLDRVFPVWNSDFYHCRLPRTPPLDRGRTASRTGQRPWQEGLRAVENQAEKSPRCADQEALRIPRGTAENQAETRVWAGPPCWLAGGSLEPPRATQAVTRTAQCHWRPRSGRDRVAGKRSFRLRGSGWRLRFSVLIHCGLYGPRIAFASEEPILPYRPRSQLNTFFR